MASLKRKIKESKVEEYKPPAYPSFSVYSNEGVTLDLDEKSIGGMFTAKVKFTGINKRTRNGKNDIDWSFEIQSLEV